MKLKARSADCATGSVTKTADFDEGVSGGGVFHFECYDKDGNLKWKDTAKNLVTNQGLQDMNTKYFKGSGYTAAWYLGLVNASPSPSYAAGDTMASHAGWSETTAYSGSNRATVNFGTATTAGPSVIDNDASQVAFNITGTVTVAGAFLTATQDNSTNTGVLFSVTGFESPGDRLMVDGDVLNVKYEFSLADA